MRSMRSAISLLIIDPPHIHENSPIFAKRPARSRRLAKRLKMNGPRRAPPRWTHNEEQKLLEMAKGEMTASEIARSLKRTPGSIYSRLQRLYQRQCSQQLDRIRGQP